MQADGHGENEIVFFFRVTVTPRRLVHSTQLHSLVNVQHVGCGCSGSPHFLDGRVLRNVCPPLEGPNWRHLRRTSFKTVTLVPLPLKTTCWLIASDMCNKLRISSWPRMNENRTRCRSTNVLSSNLHKTSPKNSEIYVPC